MLDPPQQKGLENLMELSHDPLRRVGAPAGEARGDGPILLTRVLQVEPLLERSEIIKYIRQDEIQQRPSLR